MNHFFQNITWLHYAELLVLALLAYYLYVGLRWYRAEITRLFKMSGPSQVAGLPVQPLVQISDAQDAEAEPMSVEAGRPHLQESLDDNDMLTTSLLATIAESSSGACAPLVTMEKLKAILSHYPQLRNSPRRTAINRLLVAECKKNGIAQLSEEVVDGWWQV